jgi:hypothetical protein
MVQTQLFIDSGRQKTTSYHLATIEVTSANTVYNTTITITLNGVDLDVVFDSSPETVIAAFIATAINTSGTHRAGVVFGTSEVEIESLIAGS